MENKLMPLSDFVLKTVHTPNINEAICWEQTEERLQKIYKYTQFLKQPLALCMFVPCDVDGKPLEECNEPNKEDYWDIENDVFNAELYNYNRTKFTNLKKAKSRVLFEWFRIVDFEEHQIESLKHTSYLQWDDIDLISKKDWEEEWNFEDYTVEFLLTEPTAEITLTETAIKQIYGS
ncbi:hypothetical protein HZP67_09880 [Elizabethkingia anophelis]|nr:hypothetical protein [Elizabethkingia anophelis]MCT4148150.1 hypothetical protein [Elizabethkingia anophelis]